MQKKNGISRRDFFKTAGFGLLSLPILAKVLSRGAYAQNVPKTLVAANDPMAMALGYVKDAKLAPATKRVKRADVEGKDQFCKTCNFYKPTGQVSGLWAGQCTVIPTGLVAETGWCTTWTKKLPR